MSDLRFRCIPGCTACCEQKGNVYLSEDDIVKAARFLKLSPAEFELKYVYRTRYQIRLRKPPEAQCHFLAEGRCTIHPAKPTQCRLFPYWPEIIENRAQWDATARYCPGIGQGELIQIGTALEIADEMRTAYPWSYPASANVKNPSTD